MTQDKKKEILFFDQFIEKNMIILVCQKKVMTDYFLNYQNL